jgi:hypothetical protein
MCLCNLVRSITGGVLLSLRGSCVTDEHPKAAWFRGRALECVMFALCAKDIRIKQLQTLEAERWLRLAELKRAPVESDSGPIVAR